jgi:hypothetical protein
MYGMHCPSTQSAIMANTRMTCADNQAMAKNATHHERMGINITATPLAVAGLPRITRKGKTNTTSVNPTAMGTPNTKPRMASETRVDMTRPFIVGAFQDRRSPGATRGGLTASS